MERKKIQILCFGLDFNPESGATHSEDRIKSNKLLVKLE